MVIFENRRAFWNYSHFLCSFIVLHFLLTQIKICSCLMVDFDEITLAFYARPDFNCGQCLHETRVNVYMKRWSNVMKRSVNFNRKCEICAELAGILVPVMFNLQVDPITES